MSRREEVVTRMLKLKRTLEDYAEAELARTLKAESQAAAVMNETRDEWERAATSRATGKTGGEVQSWHAYMQSLEVRFMSEERTLHEAQQQVRIQRQSVQDAYFDEQKWQTVAKRENTAAKLQLEKRDQTHLDELVTFRSGRERP